MKFDIVTIFPEAFESYLNASMMRKAIGKKIVSVAIHDLRDYTDDARKTVDDRPYGGGPGMILKIEPIFRCLKKIYPRKKSDVKVILFAPKGKVFTQSAALKWSKKLKRIIMICGHYEGVDERVGKLAQEEISIGDYVLTGGELPALVVIDAVSRLLKGVLGNKNSLKIETSAAAKEYPQYTRPEIFEPKKGRAKWRVPKILLSGNHKKIEEWRAAQMS